MRDDQEVFDVEFTDEEVQMMLAANPYVLPLQQAEEGQQEDVPWDDLLVVLNTFVLSPSFEYTSEFGFVLRWVSANAPAGSLISTDALSSGQDNGEDGSA